ncbi:oxidoreductase [Ascochyta rabiei]|uniref:Oxidoreductase n=1 Tax=Didymella rabiei TaxID=5454 RepID=A0A163EZP1_DIDRA|nr:oxidoreductase [Ascochyta rabiei]
MAQTLHGTTKKPWILPTLSVPIFGDKSWPAWQLAVSLLFADKDIPDLAGKVILVTGSNSGLGKESILQLAKHGPRQIIMAARSQARAETAVEEIEAAVPGAKVAFLALDLSSFNSIKKAAASVVQQYDRLDFGSNHMGPALFIKLLPILEKTSKLSDSDHLSGCARYGQPKLANLYFIKSLAKRYPGIKCASLHPGIVNTGITTNTIKNYPELSWIFNAGIKLFFTDVQTGALGQLWATAGRSDEIETGAYYTPVKKKNKAEQGGGQ